MEKSEAKYLPVWHTMDEKKPDKPGDYLVLSELGPGKEGEESIYCDVSVAKYWPHGYLIPYMPDIPPEKRGKLTAKERLDRILYPHYWQTQEGWYELDDTDIGLRLLGPGCVLCWAELPQAPASFAGNQNEYMSDWYADLLRLENRPKVTLDEPLPEG